MLLVSVGFCAGLAFYRFALESVVLKKRRKKREVDRVARRSVALREGKDAIEGETYVQCKGGEGESMKNDKSEEKEKETRSTGSFRTFPAHGKNTALVIIDMQSDFLSKSGRLGQHYSRDVLERLEATTANVATAPAPICRIASLRDATGAGASPRAEARRMSVTRRVKYMVTSVGGCSMRDALLCVSPS